MKPLVLLAALLLASPAVGAPTPARRCPGETTLEMRLCAGQSLEASNSQLQRRLPGAAFRQWRQTSQAVCARAYAPYRDGSIYPQLVVGCEDHLNRALLKEFAPLNNQGDLERTP